jgi:hypothetical protein
MKVNKPSKSFRGHIYIEYTGNNVIFLNSGDVGLLQDITLFEFLLINGQRERCCFRISLLNEKYIICFESFSIYKFDIEANKYKLDDWCHLLEYVTYTNRDVFMVAGKLSLFNNISETDGRNETYNFNIILDNMEVITNFFN